jgi:hypothetical protein
VPRPLYPGEKAPGTHWIDGWVDPRAGLDDVEKRKFLALPEFELRPVGRPARSQSLHRLRYPGSFVVDGWMILKLILKIGCQGVDEIHVARCRVHCRALVNTAVNFYVLYNVENCLAN